MLNGVGICNIVRDLLPSFFRFGEAKSIVRRGIHRLQRIISDYGSKNIRFISAMSDARSSRTSTIGGIAPAPRNRTSRLELRATINCKNNELILHGKHVL